VIITPVVHNFWTMEGQEQKVEIVTFFKNCALIGALLVFISDQRLRRATLRQAQKQNQVPPKQVLSKQTESGAVSRWKNFLLLFFNSRIRMHISLGDRLLTPFYYEQKVIE